MRWYISISISIYNEVVGCGSLKKEMKETGDVGHWKKMGHQL